MVRLHSSAQIETSRSGHVKFCKQYLQAAAPIFFYDMRYGIDGGSLYDVKDKNCSRLLFGAADALKLYEIMYNMPHDPARYLRSLGGKRSSLSNF